MTRFVLLLVLALPMALPAAAQPRTAPTIPSAESAFDRGLRAFRNAQFEDAYQAFIRAATDFEFNQRTTAAYLMAGKSVYALGEFDAAIEAMTMFLDAYPASRYVEEAERVRAASRARQGETVASRPVQTLGVALPMGQGDRPFTQSLFNGLRLAVDEYNAANPGAPVRMVFRDSGGDDAGAASAVEALQRAGAAFVVGPLYSEEAIGAAQAAARARLPLIAPLATDEAVSAGQRYVFQANPTFSMRGRQMARFADAQGLARVGIVVVRGSLAETEAEAFAAEAERLGRAVVFFERIEAGSAWGDFVELVGRTRIDGLDALYLPVSGSGADEQAAAALRALDTAEVSPERLRVLGNAEYQGLIASRPRAARYRTVFANDFFELSGSQNFATRYRTLADDDPDRLAYKGYDLGTMLLAELRTRRAEEPADEVLRRAAPFQGTTHRIDFNGGQVNEALFFLRFDAGTVVLVE